MAPWPPGSHGKVGGSLDVPVPGEDTGRAVSVGERAPDAQGAAVNTLLLF